MSALLGILFIVTVYSLTGPVWGTIILMVLASIPSKSNKWK